MTNQKEGGIVAVGNRLTRWSQKYMPDPTIFAILLTVLAYIISLIFTKSTPISLLDNWWQGFWTLLTFAMQMALVVITGGAVAQTRVVSNMIEKIAAKPKNGKQAAALIAFVAILLSYVHYGLSSTIGAILAKRIGLKFYKEKKSFSYGLFGAAAYTGMMTWCCGLSTSVGLTIATPGHFLEDIMGVVPFTDFIFHPLNISMAIVLVILMPLFVYLIHPEENREIAIPQYAIDMFERESKILSEAGASKAKDADSNSVGERLNNSRIVGMGLGIVGLVYVIYLLVRDGFGAFNLNSLNGIFLFLGLILQGNISNYVKAFANSTSNASGIIFQFPFYAGIMGIIQYSGMVDVLANGLVAISTPKTFFIMNLLVASIINMFVPSGGGQWAVQGPISMTAAGMMHADQMITSLTVAFGNSLTNLAQPFWALSVLGITELKAKDMMGYSMTIMLAGTVIMFGLTAIFSFI